MPPDQTALLDLSDKIEQLLCPAYRKGRDDYISSPVKGLLDDLSQLLYVIRPVPVASVTVGGFHYHIIGLLQIMGITDQRLVLITDIAGEHDLFLCISFPDPQLHRCGTQQVSRIHKTDTNTVRQHDLLIIRTSDQTLDRPVRIIHIIERHKFFFSCTPALPVTPLCLKHLDMGTVTQHDLTQITRRRRGKDLPPESSLVQKRQPSGMIDMGMRQKRHVDLACGYGDLLILIFIRSLLHSAVDQQPFPTRLQIKTAPCHLMRRPEKHQFHRMHPL